MDAFILLLYIGALTGHIFFTAALFFWVAESFYDLCQNHVAAAKASQRMGRAARVAGCALGCTFVPFAVLAMFFAPEKSGPTPSIGFFLITLGASAALGILAPWLARRREQYHLSEAEAAESPDS